jgi:hypothetical protein
LSTKGPPYCRLSRGDKRKNRKMRFETLIRAHGWGNDGTPYPSREVFSLTSKCIWEVFMFCSGRIRLPYSFS